MNLLHSLNKENENISKIIIKSQQNIFKKLFGGIKKIYTAKVYDNNNQYEKLKKVYEYIHDGQKIYFYKYLTRNTNKEIYIFPIISFDKSQKNNTNLFYNNNLFFNNYKNQLFISDYFEDDVKYSNNFYQFKLGKKMNNYSPFETEMNVYVGGKKTLKNKNKNRKIKNKNSKSKSKSKKRSITKKKIF
jgi:hypothetical protein